MSFVTIAILICQLNVTTKHPKDLFCFDKGIQNLRIADIKTSDPLEYFKCKDRNYKDCQTEFGKQDGCKFTLNNKEVFYSSYVCP